MWNKHPETRGCFFAVTNNSEHAVRGLQRKGLGLVSGISDCLFFWKGILYCFEFKSKTGKQSDRQKWWQNLIENQGAIYYLINDVEIFEKIILGIIKKPSRS
jgi:hypothetical protein